MQSKSSRPTAWKIDFFPSFHAFAPQRWRCWRRLRLRRRHHIVRCFTANKKLMINCFRGRRKQRRRVFILRRQNAGGDDDNQLTIAAVAALPVTTGRPRRRGVKFFRNGSEKKIRDYEREWVGEGKRTNRDIRREKWMEKRSGGVANDIRV